MTDSRVGGRFILGRRLGEGGFGTVFAARDTLRGQDIAIKRLHRFRGSALSKFKDEFRQLVANAIVHPNVIRLGELHNDDDEWLYTMELVKGVPFSAYVWSEEGRPSAHGGSIPSDTFSLPIATTTPDPQPSPVLGNLPRHENDVARDTLWVYRLRRALDGLVRGIDVIHRHRILHRDLKPGNVLVETSGRTVVLDFGLAALVDNKDDAVPSRSLAGTPAYMAPERLTAGVASEASDWYSVGVMLFEALTGQRPFDGTPVQISAAQLAHRLSPHHLNPHVPRDLSDLCDALLNADPRERPRADEILSLVWSDASGKDEAHESLGTPAAVFVGRDRHLRQLRDAATKVDLHRRPVAVLVRGESGMGKSALIREFLSRIRAHQPETLVFRGRCFEQEFVPYKALDRIVDSIARHLKGVGPEAERLLPRDIASLAELFPVLTEVDAIATARRCSMEVRDPQERQSRGIATFRELVRSLAVRQPLVLAIDDAQWGDDDSARMLRALMRPPEAPALLLLVACRTSETGNPVVESLFGSAGPGRVTGRDRRVEVESECVDVDALETEESMDLARTICGDRLGDDAVPRVVHEQSEGCPFVVELISHAMSTGGPATLDEAVTSLTGKLSTAERAFMEVVSIAGHPVEPATVIQAITQTPDEMRVVSTLSSARLIRTTGLAPRLHIEPYHDRLRRVIVAHLDEPTKRAHHRALAESLASGADATDRSDGAETIANHYGAAGEQAQQLIWVERAADTAERALAFNRAARLYATAAALRGGDDRSVGELRKKRARALANAGRGPESAEGYLAAATRADGIERLELLRRSVDQFLRSGHFDRGQPILTELCRDLDVPYPKNAVTAFLRERLGRGRLLVGRLEERLAEVSAADQAPHRRAKLQMDLCESAAYGLCMADGILGSYFASSFLLLALQSGDPVQDRDGRRR